MTDLEKKYQEILGYARSEGYKPGFIFDPQDIFTKDGNYKKCALNKSYFVSSSGSSCEVSIAAR